jgi:hypothetical protein
MKVTIINILFLISICATLKAQEPNNPPPAAPPAQTTPQPAPEPTPTPREKLQAYKIGFITHRLELTPAEAEKFWPIFNQYQKEVDDINKQRHEQNKAGASTSNTQIECDQKILDLRKKYYEEFKKVLPAAKVTKLYKAEYDFKVHVIKQVAAHKGAGVTKTTHTARHPTASKAKAHKP